MEMDLNRAYAALKYGLPPEVRRLAGAGDVDAARRRCREILDSRALSDGPKDALTAAEHMLARLPASYPYSRTRALAMVQKEIPGFSMAELDKLREEGVLDWRMIGGEPRLQRDFLDSLRLYPQWNARGLAPKNGAADVRGPVIDAMKRRGGLGAQITLLASIRPAAELALPPDTPCAAWLPLPEGCPRQSDIEILDAAPGMAAAPPDAPARTAHWRGTAADAPFWVRYRYRVFAPYVDVDAIRPSREQPDFDTGELAPHILFTPYLRALCAQLTAGCGDALQKARAIYDYVTLNTNYRFQPAYAVLENISDTCARSHWGDCGVMALLFITLCRIAGIPARWQSGLYVTPEEAGCHDWAMFYIAPHGWLWADCSFGVGAHRMGDEARRQFYFGNLDPLRMAANREFYAPLAPPCTAWRSDPYDNQSGELTAAGRGLMGDERETRVTVEQFAFDAPLGP